ncbi:MAG: hypothetical protein HC825_05730 [Oscillatoriales cyanobacterium RM1_1_9]|nr:hypothetical protein [Oscillatoriales cyanobacterium SM2_3_0]NJO47998.1 hypothetical protein [Oscillatoriales cyanobacterium RM2_1_1]NJO71320.1 hypothetical protein [Oscillatoriales cyanobacterium RM1_1_9]
MTRPPHRSNPGITVILSIAGFALVVIAVIILLQGFGLFTVIPDFVIWALVLLVLGLGILAGIRSLGD